MLHICVRIIVYAISALKLHVKQFFRSVYGPKVFVKMYRVVLSFDDCWARAQAKPSGEMKQKKKKKPSTKYTSTTDATSTHTIIFL